jgi:hypothetical protein
MNDPPVDEGSPVLVGVAYFVNEKCSVSQGNFILDTSALSALQSKMSCEEDGDEAPRERGTGPASCVSPLYTTLGI